MPRVKQFLLLILCSAWAACSPMSGAHEPARPPAGASSAEAVFEAHVRDPDSARATALESRVGADARPSSAQTTSHTGSTATFEHALLISVDGLRSDALRAVPASALPNFARLMKGAATLNARTDPDYTVTLPNHTDMITGRPVLGPDGHGWVKNDDADPGETLHGNHGAYVASMFDVAHDRDFHTGLFAGKSKFAIYAASYGPESGAPDSIPGASPGPSTVDAPARVPADATADGRRKIDVWKFAPNTPEIADLVIANLGAGERRSLVFAHYAVTDLVGHEHGWDVTPRSRYMQAVAAVDKELGHILDAIEAKSRLHGRTAVVLTADHGGGAPFKSHDQPHMSVDYIIPFLVWTGDAAPGGDLYALNAATRRDPGLSSPRMSDPGPPPIRNGDAGNLLLSLLGLPPVPGSVFGAQQELKIR